MLELKFQMLVHFVEFSEWALIPANSTVGNFYTATALEAYNSWNAYVSTNLNDPSESGSIKTTSSGWCYNMNLVIATDPPNYNSQPYASFGACSQKSKQNKAQKPKSK